MNLYKQFLLNDIEKLKKEVEYWKKMYHDVKDLNERLTLDLGFKEKNFTVHKENNDEKTNQDRENS